MISLVLVMLAGFCNAVMDIIQFKYNQSIFAKYPSLDQWANPMRSWRNKWKDGNPQLGERFPFSSTVFVWVTDLWHFAQSFMITFFVLAAIFYSPIISFDNYIIEVVVSLAILKVGFSITFEIFWSKILKL
tara:strand:+ start:186 stop:578 length:393 start_codon:yes stop_codon:yes gene_type:complete